ncbi:putative Transposase, ISXO2 [Desulfovibrio sp. X2]|uniref:transposase n=1 Tax=Desulfovibrio sp. X2 TaxID=941449 RepID=UPI000358B7F1|nr:transposase [Desulfovibrio sp. X2]EPR37318.1 putative Transposase, ISXO2 [Desulfovibrio sp. X2]
MDLVEYERHVRNEQAARRYLVKRCNGGKDPACPRCGAERVYRLADQRLRCGGCRYTFHEFSRRFLNRGGLSCRDWLRLLKLFELELTANRMVPELRLSYNTVYKAVTTLRLALLAGALDAPQLLHPSSGLDLGIAEGSGRAAEDASRASVNLYPVFGILEKNGWVFIDLLPHVRAENVLHFNLHFSLKLTRMGNIVYTDRYQHYDALMFCGDDGLPLNYVNIRGRSAYVDSLSGNFWSFARTRLRRFNGVTPKRFPLYLKELEFRYNHRNEDIFPLLADRLCALVPECGQA